MAQIRNWYKSGARNSKHAYREGVKVESVGHSFPFGDPALANISVTIKDPETVDHEKGADRLRLSLNLDEARDLWTRLGQTLEAIGKHKV